MGRNLAHLGCCLMLVSLLGCRPPRITSVPERLDAVEGFASLRFTGDAGGGRSRFSFLFYPPRQGRVDVSDFMGRTLFQIVIEKGKGYFILPSRKVYWAGGEAEILAKFLGFEMTLSETVGMLTGIWGEKEGLDRNWELEKDQAGRVLGGRRSDLRFWVEDFFADGVTARTIGFEHRRSSGRLKILEIAYNPPPGSEPFRLNELDGYALRTWEEIQAMMEHDD